MIGKKIFMLKMMTGMMTKMTINETIDNLKFQQNAKKMFSDGSFENQAIEYLKELEYRRASIKNRGEVTVRELILRLMMLNIDRPIYLMDKDMYSQEIRINSDANGYFITGGEGYFDNEN